MAKATVKGLMKAYEMSKSDKKHDKGMKETSKKEIALDKKLMKKK